MPLQDSPLLPFPQTAREDFDLLHQKRFEFSKSAWQLHRAVTYGQDEGCVISAAGDDPVLPNAVEIQMRRELGHPAEQIWRLTQETDMRRL